MSSKHRTRWYKNIRKRKSGSRIASGPSRNVSDRNNNIDMFIQTLLSLFKGRV